VVDAQPVPPSVSDRERSTESDQAGLRPAADLLAALSELAVGPLPHPGFERRAADLVAELFEAEGSALLRVTDGGLEVAATHDLALPGEGTVFPLDEGSQPAFILASDDVVVVEDLARERRFEVAEALEEVGFRSLLALRVGTSSQPQGAVEIYRRSQWSPGDEDLAFLRAVAGLLAVGIERRTTVEEPAREGLDQLTGLPDRTAVLDALTAPTDPSIGVGTLLHLGLDGFRAVNARHGHDIGDEALRLVADRLGESIRDSDLVARLDGDEFALVCGGLGASRVEQFAERLIGRVEEAIDVDGHHISVSASVGAAIGRPDADPEALLATAKSAMARAKDEGRGRVVIGEVGVGLGPVAPVADPASPPQIRVTERRLASVIGGVHAVFQPIVRATDHTIVGLEALARGPMGSELAMPDSLFSAAAAHGRVAEVELAAKRAAFSASLPEGIPLFVNLDPSVLVQDGWLDSLVGYWERLGRRRQVVVELTERSLTASPQRLLAAVERCRKMGWLIALDDIGVRAESLTVLRIVRPDVIKLDMSLTADPTTPHASAVATAVASHRERGHVHVIAEGVESLTHELSARVLGADYLQGYWFGRPAAAGDLPLTSESGDSGPSPLLVPADGKEVGRHGRSVATRHQLLGLSRYIESISWSSDAIVLAAIQNARHYTATTQRRFSALARRCGMVGVIGQGLESGVVDGVKQADLAAEDGLVRSWQVVNLSTAGGVALLADEVGPARLPDADRLFRYRITSVGSEVEQAAVRLLGFF
jgi:diguanylate cyclase (GGDEF)-like protein